MVREAPPLRIHCSYHKCMTVYVKRVLQAVFNGCLPWSGGYRHYNSDLQAFQAELGRRRIASVNNHALDLEALGATEATGAIGARPFRITRFVRDPRDLVVSGYHYHRRGAEPWTRLPNPGPDDWRIVHGNIPEAMRGSGQSFAEHLQGLSEEEGLLAELEFRRHHFDSMARWPAEHPDVLTMSYEEALADQVAVMERLFAFHRFSRVEHGLGRFFARRYSLQRRSADPHVRNPSSGQWRRHFTPRVTRAFEQRHGALLELLGYAR